MFGSPLRKAVSFGLFASTAALAVALTLGFFSAWHPAFDSFAHFRVHLGALLVMTAPLLFFAAYRLHAAAALLLGLGAISTTLPAGSLPELGSVQAALPPEANQPVYKLLQLNLRYNNAEPEKVLSFIGRVRPDVVTLDEVSTMWEGKLALLKAAYPYQINCRVRRFGVALRRAGHSPRARSHVALTAGSLAIAQVDLGGVTIDVAAIHLAWPWPFEQEWQLGNLAEPLGRLGETGNPGRRFQRDAVEPHSRKGCRHGRTDALCGNWPDLACLCIAARLALGRIAHRSGVWRRAIWRCGQPRFSIRSAPTIGRFWSSFHCVPVGREPPATATVHAIQSGWLKADL